MMRMLITGGSGFIGTNLIDVLLEKGIPLINLDNNAPKKTAHQPYWQKCDILDFDETMRCFAQFQPTHVIHLAARTDTISDNLNDYKTNTEGTHNVLSCIKAISNVQRVILTSSQFAFGPPGIPVHDEDYKPIGAYGLSKVISEKTTRSAGLECVWTITRPTNIWGPWHPRYPKEFWLVLKRGLYFHPGGRATIRSYGYVKNIIYQMMKILEAHPNLVDKKVYYLGDKPIKLIDWVNSFSLTLTGKPVRVVPWWLLKTLASVGSLVNSMGVRFPITLSRYTSMTVDYVTPMEVTINDFGLPPYSLEEGVSETVLWLNRYWSGQAF